MAVVRTEDNVRSERTVVSTKESQMATKKKRSPAARKTKARKKTKKKASRTAAGRAGKAVSPRLSYFREEVMSFEVVVKPEAGGQTNFAEDAIATASNLDGFRRPAEKSVLTARKLQKN